MTFLLDVPGPPSAAGDLSRAGREHGRLDQRHREWWTDERDAELVALVQGGLVVEESAERAGRTVGAIKTQCVKLLPPDLVISQTTSVERLRELLDFPGYDWRESLRERARRAPVELIDGDPGLSGGLVCRAPRRADHVR
ncbi:hypothetical protein F3087_45705, partial [Nocardia colli]